MRHHAIDRQFEALERERARILPARVGSRDDTRGQGEGPHHGCSSVWAAQHGPHVDPVNAAARSSNRRVNAEDGGPVTRRAALRTASPYHFFHACTI
jgi:hypothetical protein